MAEMMDKRQRDAILADIDALEARLYSPRASWIPTPELRQLADSCNALLERYLGGLPRVPVGRCPHCQGVTRRTIDVFGLDGPWWSHFGPDLLPEACSHYIATLGALDLRSQTPVEAAARKLVIHPGPQVPYVVPRLLDRDGTACVLHALAIGGGRYLAYLMSYYADPPAPLAEAHQSWPRDTWAWVDEAGNTWSDTRNDVWSFTLRRWLDRTQPAPMRD